MIALFLTIIVEFFPVFFLMRGERSLGSIVFIVVAVNLLTNPIANHLYPEFSFWWIEAGVVVAEALLFALLFEVDVKKGMLLSLCANIPSIVLSLALFALTL